MAGEWNVAAAIAEAIREQETSIPKVAKKAGIPSGVRVTVGGDRGVSFSGAIGSLNGMRSVTGTTPETFTIASGGTVYSAAIQKSGASRQTLSVTISCPSGPAASQSTSAPYGVASVAC